MDDEALYCGKRRILRRRGPSAGLGIAGVWWVMGLYRRRLCCLSLMREEDERRCVSRRRVLESRFAISRLTRQAKI